MNDNRIYWVRGNTQELLIPLEQEIVPQEGEVEVVPYYPDAEATVTVCLVGKYKKYTYTPTVDGNLLRFTESGTVSAGVYGVEVLVNNPDGTQYRSLWDNQIVVTNQNDSVLQEWDEFRQLDIKARAAVFFFAKGDNGDAFTYDDFTPEQIAELQKPAHDAAEELTQEVHTFEQQFTEQENQRIANESQREENETSRVQAENARHQQFSADHQQAVSDHTQYESDHTNELQRQQNELERKQAETLMGQAEAQRVIAENNRAAAETERHTQYTTDHATAVADHTQADNDHTASVDVTAKASNVNVTIDGMVVTITDKNGVSTSVNIGFDITKTYASVAAMNADAANVEEGTFVMIATTDTTSAENARLYVRNSNAASSSEPFTFLCDLDQAATSAWADWFNNYKPTIESDHTRAENDHTLAASDHVTAQSDHTQYTQDHEKEMERESAETLRKQSETQRQTNETARQQAEAHRVETFAGYETFMHGYDDRLSALEITQEQFNGIFND